jgi:RimJ/RimL family protein N-acetyltransferase
MSDGLAGGASVPTIETERLRLRGHRIDDHDAVAAMWADEQVTRFIGASPFSRQEAWARILRYRGLWALLGYGYWVVEEKQRGSFLGEVGFAEFQREMTPSIVGSPEAGWCFAAHAHGKGYATEALRAALSWVDRESLCECTVCLIDPANEPSIHLASKCGFTERSPAVCRGKPTLILERQNIPSFRSEEKRDLIAGSGP